MYNLISIGTVGIDLYFKGDSLTYSKNRFELAIGGKYFTDYFYEGLGGGGANVAIGAAKNDSKVALIAKIGNNPFKKIIMDKLDTCRITHRDFCQFSDDYFNISTILLTEEGEKTIINYRSPHQHFMTCEDDYKLLLKTHAIYLANMPNVPLTERAKMLSYANHHAVDTFVNLGVVDCRRPKTQLHEFLKKVDVLMINGYEFADLVKAPYKDIEFEENIVRHYIPELNDHLVVITDGEKGSYVYQKGKIYFQKAIAPHKIVDATGAGDGYTAGFIAEYLKTYSIEKSMHVGAKYASYILGVIGAN